MSFPHSPERNIADSLADHLPKPQAMGEVMPFGGGSVRYVALPENFKIEKLDDEQLLGGPRRAKGTASMADAQSFIAYVQQHASAATKVWCDFDPQTYKLRFTAVLDDHQPAFAGWREHRVVYEPRASAEWKTWTGKDRQPMEQVAFAGFLEDNAEDINTGPENKFPTSLDMLRMATEFEANGERRCKSIVRLQGGGVRLTYVDDEDENTQQQMQAFERFMIGLPVFWAGPGYRIEARLKYRTGSKVAFWYELIRPDRAHESAAMDLIETVRKQLGQIPMLMGDCK